MSKEWWQMVVADTPPPSRFWVVTYLATGVGRGWWVISRAANEPAPVDRPGWTIYGPWADRAGAVSFLSEKLKGD